MMAAKPRANEPGPQSRAWSWRKTPEQAVQGFYLKNEEGTLKGETNMIARLHSRRSGYFLLGLAILFIEVFFGYRSAVMYGAAFAQYLGFWELLSCQVVVGMGVAIGGYVLSTHRQFGVEAIAERLRGKHEYKADVDHKIWWSEVGIMAAVVVVVLHEFAGVIYTLFGKGQPATLVTIVVTIGMCAFALLPFFLGHMQLALAESINAENAAEYDNKINKLDKQVRIQAAEEIAKRSSNLSPEQRLAYGIRGMLPQSRTNVQDDQAVTGHFREIGDDEIGDPLAPRLNGQTKGRAAKNQ